MLHGGKEYVRHVGILMNRRDDEPEESGDQAPGGEIDSESGIEFSGVECTGGGIHVGSEDPTARNKDSRIG